MQLKPLVLAVIIGGVACQAVAAPPGACWQAEQASIPSAHLEGGLRDYCAPLREGRKFLEWGRPDYALTAFCAARIGAVKIGDIVLRDMADIEATAGIALAVEGLGRKEDSEHLMPVPDGKSPDVLAFARAAIKARSGAFQQALLELRRAKEQLPNYWCTQHDEALAALGNGQMADILRWHHLPSFLRQSIGGNCATKGFGGSNKATTGTEFSTKEPSGVFWGDTDPCR